MEIQAIEKIEQMVKDGLTIEVDGRKYTTASLHPVIYNPRPAALTVHNLRGFCGFINNDIDKLIKGNPYLIVVNSPESVDLVSAVDETEKKRSVLVKAEIDKALQKFPFGTFLSQEEFAITFRSLFMPGKKDDFEYVLAYSQKLKGGTEIEGEDDGITQKITIKRGMSVHLSEKAELKPIVKLTPYRTFREAEQPESEFLLRVRMNQNDAPTVALFEADGGAWINKATENVVEYIQSIVKDIPVIA
jgi:hypothetical protein